MLSVTLALQWVYINIGIYIYIAAGCQGVVFATLLKEGETISHLAILILSHTLHYLCYNMCDEMKYLYYPPNMCDKNMWCKLHDIRDHVLK